MIQMPLNFSMDFLTSKGNLVHDGDHWRVFY